VGSTAYGVGMFRRGWTVAFVGLLACAILAGCGSSETEETASGTSSPRPSTGSTVQPDLVSPSTPTNLTAAAIAPAQVNLSWGASSDDVGVAGYRVYRGGTLLTTLAGRVTTHQDTTVVASTTYSYTVQAFDAAGNFSGQSPAAIVSTPSTLDTTAPSAPTGLTATTVSLSQINLSWTASTDNIAVTAYRIVRNGVPFQDVPASATTYEDRGLLASTTYVYTVRALDAAGNISSASAAASATTLAAPDTVPPTQPTDLVAEAASTSQINLRWTASTDNVVVASYRIYRDGAFVGAAAVTSFQDSGLNPSTTYAYNVDAVDGDGNASPLSAAASATTLTAPDTTAPSTPLGLTATAVSSSQINLNWLASTDNVAVTGYLVFRGGVQIATLGNVQSYQDTGLSPSTTYSYRVRAVDAAGNVSGQSSQRSATTFAAPDTTAPTTPTGLSASAFSSSKINLTWTESTDNVAVTGYRVYRNSVFVTALASTVTEFQDTGLSAATGYTYVVDAVDGAGNASNISNSASATTLAANTATLQWDAVNYPTLSGYRVYVGTSSGTYQQAPGSGINVGNVTTYTVTGLGAGTRYFFAVTAFDGSNNESGYSNEVFKDVP
jgi:chitodextrinase